MIVLPRCFVCLHSPLHLMLSVQCVARSLCRNVPSALDQPRPALPLNHSRQSHLRVTPSRLIVLRDEHHRYNNNCFAPFSDQCASDLSQHLLPLTHLQPTLGGANPFGGMITTLHHGRMLLFMERLSPAGPIRCLLSRLPQTQTS